MAVDGIRYGRILNFYSVISRHTHMPYFGSLELTPRCNMNCRMCYIRMSPEEMAHVGQEMSGKEWLRIAQEATDQGMMHVLLTGGEAILHPDFKEIYLGLRKMGLFISINSNATLYNDEWVDFFAQYPPAQINVTLYGGSNETYGRLCCNPKGFDQVTTAIDKMLERKLRVQINCVISRQNAEDADAIYAFCRERELKVTSTAYCFPPVRKEGVVNPELNRFNAKDAAKARIRLHWNIVNDRENFLEQAKKTLACPGVVEGLESSCVDAVGDKVLCAAGRANFWVTWDGRMLPCGLLPDFSAQVKDRPFMDAWREIVAYTAGITLCGECKSCAKKDLCSPCAAKIKSECGSFDKKPEYLCEYTDEYIRLLGEAVKYLESHEETSR